MNRIRSKHIVITGGTSGIGRELIKQLYNQNTITVLARSSRRIEKLKNDFPDLQIHQVDLASLDEVRETADKLLKQGRPVDLLVNNAAVQYEPHFLDDDFCSESIEREIDINLTAPTILTYTLLPVLLHSQGPIVVNINSGLGLVAKTSSAVYCATKGGLNLLSQSLRNQFIGTPLRVDQIFLPLVDTKMTAGRGQGKLTVEEAANGIISGIEGKGGDIYLGKAKLLNLINRISPKLARKIMRRG